MEQRAVTVVADPASADALAPLLDHWRHGPGLRLLPWSTVDRGDAHSVADLAELAAGSSAVLVVGPRQRSPRTVLPAPVLTAPDGRVVPAAWLPATSAADLARFARTAVTVHERAATAPAEAGHAASDPSRTLVVLGERHPRFDRLADRIVRIGGEEGGGVQVRRATAYELSRDDLVNLLATGPCPRRVRRPRPPGRLGRVRRYPRPPPRGCRRAAGPRARRGRRVAHLPDGQPTSNRAVVRRVPAAARGSRRPRSAR